MRTVKSFLRPVMFAVVLMFFLVCFVGCTGSSDDKEKFDKSSVSELAPDFTITSLTGKKITLSDFHGKKNVLLAFGATWCVYCRREVPELKKIHAKYRDRIEVLYVDVAESKQRVSSYAARHGITYTVLLDLDGKVANTYDVLGFPTNFIINKEGRIAYRNHGLPRDIQSYLSP